MKMPLYCVVIFFVRIFAYDGVTNVEFTVRFLTLGCTVVRFFSNTCGGSQILPVCMVDLIVCLPIRRGPVVLMNVCGDIVLLTARFFDVASFTIFTPLSLLS